LRSTPVVTLLAVSAEGDYEQHQAQAITHTISATDFLTTQSFSDELFGPATLIVNCKNTAELQEIVQALEGQLTATVHATSKDEKDLKAIVSIIIQKAGLLWKKQTIFCFFLCCYFVVIHIGLLVINYGYYT